MEAINNENKKHANKMDKNKSSNSIMKHEMDFQKEQNETDFKQSEKEMLGKSSKELNAKAQKIIPKSTDIFNGAKPKLINKLDDKLQHSEESAGNIVVKDDNDEVDTSSLIQEQQTTKKVKQKHFMSGILQFLTKKQKHLDSVQEANKDNVGALTVNIKPDVRITVTNENGVEKDANPVETSTSAKESKRLSRRNKQKGTNPELSSSICSFSSDASSSRWHRSNTNSSGGIYLDTSSTIRTTGSENQSLTSTSSLSKHNNSVDKNDKDYKKLKKQTAKQNKRNKMRLEQEIKTRKKSKPFQKLTKTKTGIYDVSIHGDQKRCHIKSITMVSNQKLVIFDKNNKCIKVFDKNFKPLDRVTVNANMCNLTATSDETVAATFPETKKLHFYSIDSMTNKITNDITHPATDQFYSVTHHNSVLYLFQRNRKRGITDPDEWEIKRLDMKNTDDKMQSLRTICPAHQDCALFANDTGIYFTNKTENEVLLLKHDGTFQYRHKVAFSLPVGITADKVGNIYVCGGSVTSFIEVIQADLRTSPRVIFNKTASNPVALYFDKQDNSLFVCDKILGKIIKYAICQNGTG